jgi:rRNA-processing protein FCF1
LGSEQSARKTRPSVQILLDTSFLVTMLKLHRDPEEEIRTAVPGNVKILVLDIVIFELERLARKASAKTHAFASASLDFLERRKLSVIEHKPGPADVDAALIASALTERTPTGIATVDRAIRSALASQDVPVIYPKARRGLVAERFHF